MKEWEDKLSIEIKLPDIESKDLKDQIYLILERRLEYEQEYMPKWREAMILGAMPQNIPVISQRVFSTMNTIWDMLGDKSNGSEWYIKRYIIGQIFVTTEVFMAYDGSQNFSKALGLLKDQLENQKFEGFFDIGTLWYNYNASAFKYVWNR
jgi:ubiquinone biosynthesis protein COQ9